MSGIHHIALRVKDCARSARFYEQAFGLREIRRVDSGDGLRAIWLGAGKTVLMLEHSLRGGGAPARSAAPKISTWPEPAGAEERFKDLGIEVTDRTASTLYVSDPDGHRAGVSTFPFSETGS